MRRDKGVFNKDLATMSGHLFTMDAFTLIPFKIQRDKICFLGYCSSDDFHPWICLLEEKMSLAVKRIDR
ncbi:hypothetical protein J6590_091574 [Homalodisca vitripennis]|nr:hypothetical protein J6590_091574 [Homalodisca vitripennis]